MKGCSVDQPCSRCDGDPHGTMSIEPNRMAILAPAIVIVNGLRKIENCFASLDLTRVEGMNREPTAR